MKIFYYYWGENSKDDMLFALSKAGHDVVVSETIIRDYDDTASCEQAFGKAIRECSADILFSFNYFPFLSEFAKKHELPYISWVYDCPHLTLYSTTISNDCNHIFIFDRKMCETTMANGAKHVYHMPLAVNKERLQKLLSGVTGYEYNVSFVGSTYDNNLYDKIGYLPEYLRGYINSMMTSQQKLWGINLIPGLLTDDTIERLSEYVKLPEDPRYTYTDREIFSDIIIKKLASIERKDYTSAFPDIKVFSEKNPVSYLTEMPAVFKKSRINLNISLRSIESGIPLRCLDIMGSGGFLLTNYQPELDEYFVNGEEYVYYESKEDMLEKINYYLSQDAEREAIAERGQKKVYEKFNMTDISSRIIDIAMQQLI